MTEHQSVVVNGVARRIGADPDTPLIYILRNHLGLKGTRFGCGVGACGACTVLIEGRPTPSCNTPLWSTQGKSITTIEGLGQGDTPHPLQQAVLDRQAGQCGYCLSGIIMRAAALIQENPRPLREQLAGGLAEHLCRCGAHSRILDALERVATSAHG